MGAQPGEHTVNWCKPADLRRHVTSLKITKKWQLKNDSSAKGIIRPSDVEIISETNVFELKIITTWKENSEK